MPPFDEFFFFFFFFFSFPFFLSFSVPLHLHALDLYNRPSATDRVAFIRREYGKTVLARWGRIFPAFGVGGVINLQMQDLLNSQLGRPH
jgi:hypothetical protein